MTPPPETPDSPPDEKPRRKLRPFTRPLERGWVKHKLIRQLALGEVTQQVLADEYGVTQPAIAEFKRRHLSEVEAARENIADEFASLWIAKKAARLAEYEADVDDINTALVSVGPDSQLLGAKHKALRMVAEELGQIPNRQTVEVEGTTVHYVVDGVDMSQLR